MRRAGKTKKRHFWAAALFVVLLSALSLFALWSRDALLKAAYPCKFPELVMSAAQEANLPPALVYAVIRTESSFLPSAKSGAGAMGLMQITNDTADFVVSKGGFDELSPGDIYDPETNIRVGCWLLSYLTERYEDLDTALCAYNAGMGNVAKWLADSRYSADGARVDSIPFEETRDYVKKVNKSMAIYQKLYFNE
jgi:soluble lytic murein transglycosylase